MHIIISGLKIFEQEKKEATKEEMVGWHHQLNGHEFEQIPRDGEGHGVSKSQTQLSDRTTTEVFISILYYLPHFACLV